MQGWLQETLQKSLAGTQDGENPKAHTHHKLKDGPLTISTFGLIAKPKTDIQDTLERFDSTHFDASLQHFDAWGFVVLWPGISMLLLVALNAKLQSSLHDKGVTALDGNTTAIQIRN